MTTIKYEVNNENVVLNQEMVRKYLVNGGGNVSDQEVVMFMQLCRYQKLNPFLNEAYLVKFGRQPASIITSKEAFMKRAENNIHYKGFQAGIVVARGNDMKYLNGALMMPKDKLIGGWADVYRDDRKAPIHIEVALDEFIKYRYNKDTHKMEVQATWKTMQKTMIRKTAIVNALREAFPENLGSMYTEDDKQPVKDINAEETEDKPKEKLSDIIEPKNTDSKEKETKQDESADKTDEQPAKDVTPKSKEANNDNSDEKTKNPSKEPKKQTDEELFAELKANNCDKKEGNNNGTKEHEQQGALFNQLDDTKRQ